MSGAVHVRAWACVLLAVAVQLAGCYGSIWPSRVIAVRIDEPKMSGLDVARFVAKEIQRRGFVDIGADGRDELEGQRRIFNFQGGDEMLISVDVSGSREVQIRVSQNRAFLTPDAKRIYEDLAAALEGRWPGTVTRDEAARQ